MSILLFLSTFCLYLATMAPSITVGDAGEFCASATTLSMAHSPGYPLFSLIGKCFTVFFPLGSFAYRVNLVSAVSAALTIVLLYLLIRSIFEKENPTVKYLALIPALFAAVSPAFWRSAVQTEVFTLNTLFAVAMIFALYKERYYLALFLFGLGIGNHHTLIFAAPFILIEFYRKRLINPSNLFYSALFFALGFSVYLYLPIRSFKNPGLDWGNPETLHNIWRVISRADYGSLSLTVGEKMARNIPITFHQVTRFLTSFNFQFTIAGILLGIAGCYAGFKNKSTYLKSMLALWLLAGPGFIILSNLPFNAESEGILDRFYILVNIFWAFPIAYGTFYLYERWRSAVSISVIGLGLIAATAAANYSALNWRGYYLEYDYGRNLLKTFKPNSIFFMDGGDDTFYSMAYLCFAENRRPDVELHDRGGLVFKSLYGPDFRKITKDEKEARRQQVERSYLGIRPIYYSSFNSLILPGVKMRPNGILMTPETAANINAWPMYSLRGVYDRGYDDYRSRALVPVYPFFAAMHEPAKKNAFRNFAITEWPDCLWLKGNIRMDILREAYNEYSAGQRAKAEETYKNVLKIFPDELSAYINLGVIEKDKRNTESARMYYREALKRDPNYADAYYNLSVSYWDDGNWQEVVNNLRRLLEINPNDQRGLHYLPIAEAKMKQ